MHLTYEPSCIKKAKNFVHYRIHDDMKRKKQIHSINNYAAAFVHNVAYIFKTKCQPTKIWYFEESTSQQSYFVILESWNNFVVTNTYISIFGKI